MSAIGLLSMLSETVETGFTVVMSFSPLAFSNHANALSQDAFSNLYVYVFSGTAG